MLSPKMQRNIRVNDSQLIMLSERANFDHSLSGYLHKRTADSTKWQLRWFVLYQNLLFYYESENGSRPSGVILLEGCYCERQITTASKSKEAEKSFCFTISYRRENQRQYELRASSESDCKTWIEAIREASFNKMLLQKEELEQKHLHLLQIVESEKTAKWQYTQQCEELTSEIKKLRAELCALKKEWRPVSYTLSPTKKTGENTSAAGMPCTDMSEESAELRKIKKVQSFFRGWLCRRRWKQIVEQYIKSPHAESMRKRNSLVFRMVEAEEEYMEQMEVLVSCFLRPFKMAASSKKPPCSHEDVNSIFLNSETVLFLHQIFLKGLTSRMESWPTLVLGDLFNMLLPMLSIYQEYVRNHHYSLQVLTECKQSQPFAQLLARLENKPACSGRSLETFLTYPMHQVPRYIITLHEILAHTPHDHVERKSLMNARQQLEDLSRQMHDEVSETENLRKNLAVERMIVEGCDILLDVNQVFVRQGTLVQLPNEKSRTGRSRLPSFKSEKEALRQCFLFSNHMIIATRTSGGRLHLVPDVGKIPLADAMLIEDPSDHGNNDEDESSVGSTSSQSSDNSTTYGALHNRDFKIVVDVKGGSQGSIHLAAPTIQEKAAWISDISQCMDNVHFNDFIHGSISDTSSVSMPHSIKNDPKLFKDDVDIRFSKRLNSCKVPQIRYATPERLLERLTDLRFLSIDFLNTFLLTYRIFTDGVQVLEALKKVFYDAEPVDKPPCESMMSLEEGMAHRDDNTYSIYDQQRRSSYASPRRVSAASSVSGYGSEMSERDGGHLCDSHLQMINRSHWRCSYRKFEEEQRELALIREGSSQGKEGSNQASPRKMVTIRVESEESGCHLTVPNTLNASSSAETLTDLTVISAPTSPSNLSTATLVGSDNSNNDHQESAEGTKKGETTKSENPRLGGTILPTVTVESQADREKEAESKTDNPAGPKGGEQPRKVPEYVSIEIEKPAEEEKGSASAGSKQNLNPASTSEEGGRQAEDKWNKSAKKDKDRDGKSKPDGKEKTERPGGRFSDGLLTIDSKFRRYRSKSAERRSRPGSKRKGSEGVITFCETKRKGSDALSREGSLKSAGRRKSSSASGQERRESGGWPRSWANRRKSSTGSPYGRLTDVEFSDESGSEWPTSTRSGSISTTQSYYGGRRGTDVSTVSTIERGNCQPDTSQNMSKAGVVITSYRQSKRSCSDGVDSHWSSTSAAAAAFAIATSASSNPRERSSVSSSTCSFARYKGSAEPGARAGLQVRERGRKESSIISTPATMRVLNVLRHWVSKHAQDFESDQRLKNLTIEFLEDISYSPYLLPAEYKAVNQLLRLITKEEPESSKINLDVLLAVPTSPSKESIETLSALEIAEQIAFIDHQIFLSITSEEFLGQAWMKADKAKRAPHILLMTKRFNEMSQLVVYEIVRRSNISARVAVIEKWAAVADISKCLHNFNGVLQICAAFTNSSVFRLKKTWEKVSKTTKQTIDRLQNIVSSDSRFRNLRDALHRCDPPCIPYLGMYLTDLSFIEEGTPNFTEDGLLNFSKMRMIAHVIREIKLFQQSRYKVECIRKVTDYLLDPSLILDDEELYQMSLELEPRKEMEDRASLDSVASSANALQHKYSGISLDISFSDHIPSAALTRLLATRGTVKEQSSLTSDVAAAQHQTLQIQDILEKWRIRFHAHNILYPSRSS